MMELDDVQLTENKKRKIDEDQPKKINSLDMFKYTPATNIASKDRNPKNT